MEFAPGWMSDSELAVIEHMAKTLNRMRPENIWDDSRKIVEIGSFLGRSTQAWSKFAPDCKIICVDPLEGNLEHVSKTWADPTTMHGNWQDLDRNTPIHNIFIENTKNLKNVHLIREYSSALRRLNINHPADIIFIDGDHTLGGLKNDFMWALKNIKHNGIICGHDYGHQLLPQVKNYVDNFVNNIGDVYELIVPKNTSIFIVYNYRFKDTWELDKFS